MNSRPIFNSRFGLTCRSQDDTTDWKIIGINVNDPLSDVVNSKTLLNILVNARKLTRPAIDDLEKYRPGLKQTFYDWFVVSSLSAT
jgi:inorganic pyrophosphatase